MIWFRGGTDNLMPTQGLRVSGGWKNISARGRSVVDVVTRTSGLNKVRWNSVRDKRKVFLPGGGKPSLSPHFSYPVNLSFMGRKKSASSATMPKNKGGRPAWATEEQLEWLATKLPDFVASRTTNAPGDFWPTLYTDWFENWPLNNLTESEIENGVTQKVSMAHKKSVRAKCHVSSLGHLPVCSKFRIG